MYFVTLCLVILATFFVIAASTTDQFTRSLTRGEWRDYLGDDAYDDYLPHIDDFYGQGHGVVMVLVMGVTVLSWSW